MRRNLGRVLVWPARDTGIHISHNLRRGIVVATALVVSLLLAFLVLAEESEAGRACNKFASTTGSDRNSGTSSSPYRSVSRLANSLRPGQTGCLKSGVYRSRVVNINKGGKRGERVVLRSAPGQRARIDSRLVLKDSANFVTIRNLTLDGSNNGSTNAPSPVVLGNHNFFLANNVTNRHQAESCFMIGSRSTGVARHTVILNNRIHDCGRLPATNKDHGIYLNYSRGAQIKRNKIYDNADRGIQLRVNARRTNIRGNVIDGNGQGIIFSGAYGKASSYNRVINNLITNSRIRHNLEHFYPNGNPIGKGNIVRRNCVNGGARDEGRDGGIKRPIRGYVMRDNMFKYPRYVNRQADDFRLRSGSPCRRIYPG